MKKLLSVLLAILILALPLVSSAEEAAPAFSLENGAVMAYRVENIVLDFAGEKLDLTGINADIAVGAGKQGAMLQLRIGAGEKTAANVLVEFAADGIYFTADGLSDVYCVKYEQLLDLIDPSLKEIIPSVQEAAAALAAIFTEDNLADLGARFEAAFGEITEVIGTGLSDEEGTETVAGTEYTGSKLVFSYDAAAVKSMLSAIAAAYDENPGFKDFTSAISKLGGSDISYAQILDLGDTDLTVSGYVFTSEDSTATDINVNIAVNGSSTVLNFYQAINETGELFGISGNDGTDSFTVDLALAEQLTLNVTANGEKKLEATGAFTETGFAVTVNTPSARSEILIGGEKPVTCHIESFSENDFSYATLVDTIDVTVEFAGSETGFDGTVTLVNSYPDGNSDTIVINAAVRLTETGLVIKSAITYNGDTIVSYDYSITVNGSDISFVLNESANGMNIAASFAGTATDNGASGHVNETVGMTDYESGETAALITIDADTAFALSEMTEFKLAGSENVKNVIEIIAAGEDSIEYQAFMTNLLNVVMNALSGMAESCPAVAELVMGSEG